METLSQPSPTLKERSPMPFFGSAFGKELQCRVGPPASQGCGQNQGLPTDIGVGAAAGSVQSPQAGLMELPGGCQLHLLSLDRVNVGCGPAEQRLLLTGLHSVADIFCESCKTTLGWKYVSAGETSVTWGPWPGGQACPKAECRATCIITSPFPIRSKLSRPARSTRRGSTSSRCRTW